MKQIKSLGKPLSKNEQKAITGGGHFWIVSCGCNDGVHVLTGSCLATCSAASASAQNLCLPYGGWDYCSLCNVC